jgi:hypothetical protein
MTNHATTATQPAAGKPEARDLEQIVAEVTARKPEARDPREIKIQHAVARWADPDGKPIRKQDVIECWAEDWPAILASDSRFSTWSVLTFGTKIFAISPMEPIRKAIG